MQQGKTVPWDLNGLSYGGKTKKGIRGGDATTVAPGIAGTPLQAASGAQCSLRLPKDKTKPVTFGHRAAKLWSKLGQIRGGKSPQKSHWNDQEKPRKRPESATEKPTADADVSAVGHARAGSRGHAQEAGRMWFDLWITTVIQNRANISAVLCS